jgi:hypothetical protein
MICRACGRELRGASAAPWVAVEGAAYYRCPGCGHVRLEESRRLSPEAEKARYLLHRNDPAEKRYRSYLATFIDRAVAPFAPPRSRILDFGSGPVPALAVLLRERGYVAEVYDPYFAPDRRVLRGDFGFVVLHEVIEHVSRPYATLAGLARRLRPEGGIAVRTRFAPDEREAFAQWWYRRDPTHVGFFDRGTFAALAARLGGSLELVEEPDIAVLGLDSARSRQCSVQTVLGLDL